ncbi:sestrin-2-like [Protopterus annectens]|uniref:sestrin-2-like n=1 Tax=Protopterus annectens TaxID=7888 RepID=UPI001CFAC036|nr:sestrin-2-like [Protopterus annectens]
MVDEASIRFQQGEAVQEVEALMAKMKLLQQTIEEEASQEEMYTRFEKAKTESLFVTPSDKSEALHLASVSCFVEDSDFQYKDFSRRGEVTPPTFRAQDFTWEDHGYSLTTRLYPDAALLLDKKFLTAYSLTYNTMAMHCDVDTSMLRRAIWNYIHCVFGIRYENYSNCTDLIIFLYLASVLLRSCIFKFFWATSVRLVSTVFNVCNKLIEIPIRHCSLPSS